MRLCDQKRSNMPFNYPSGPSSSSPRPSPPLLGPRLTAAYGIKEHCGREQQLGEALEEHNTGHTNLRDLTSNTHGELFDKGNVWKDSAHYISEAFVEEEGK